MRRPSMLRRSIMVLGALLLAGCASGPLPGAASAPVTAQLPAFKHIFVIVMENKPAEAVTDPAVAPYINELARRYARATNFYGTTHPSLPNYLALTGGDTFGITSNCADCTVDAPNLVDQFEAAGKSWKAYMEGMPGPCFVGDAPPLYRQKHNPFVYYTSVRDDPARCKKIVPFDHFTADAGAGALPDFVWITPNMCNDMHDCGVDQGDRWLSSVVPTILDSAAWKDDGLLFITYDEGSGSGGCCQVASGGRIDTLVISPLVRPGFTSAVPYTHYSLLRTIETAWNLPLLGKAACSCSPVMSDFFADPEARAAVP